MKRYSFELYGTITRDIIWREGEYETDEEALAAVKEHYPLYRLNSWSSTLQHDWMPSTLGHGEQMCKRCFITNREAAAIGTLQKCEP